jgi:CBS-domain-containing membrane protein
MLTAQDIMTTHVITVNPETEIIQAAKLLLENHFNGLPVLNKDDKLIGIICQSDLVVQQKSIPVPTLLTFLDGFISLTSTKKIENEMKKIAAITVNDAMTSRPITVKPDTSIEAIASLMVDKNLHTLPVVDDNDNLVGILGKEDILRSLLKGTGGALG